MSTKAQLTKFIIVGLFATAINYSVFWCLLHILGNNHYTLSSAIGFISGVIAGYFPNKKWSFKSDQSEKKSTVLKYFLVYTTSLIMSILVLRQLVETLGIDVRIANVLTIGMATVINFIGAKLFVFSHDAK